MKLDLGTRVAPAGGFCRGLWERMPDIEPSFRGDPAYYDVLMTTLCRRVGIVL